MNATATLHPADSQRAFHAVLDALSRPGHITQLPGCAVHPAVLPVLALADLGTGVCVLEDDRHWAGAVAVATSAPTVPLELARLVAAARPVTAEEVEQLCRGSAHAPEDAALTSLSVSAVDGGSRTWRISGPGVPGELTVTPQGVPDGFVSARGRARLSRRHRRAAGRTGWPCARPAEDDRDRGGELMGYSGARGGLEAILAAEDLVRRARDHAPQPWAPTGQIVARFRLAVDRVMGEAGLFDENTAAAAFRQAEGDPLEASHLVRAYRSTLPRLAVGEPVDPDELVILRRIVPAFRDPDGPQLLGRTTDYTGRLLERPEGPPAADGVEPAVPKPRTEEQTRPRRFLDLLRELDLAVDHRTGEDPEPFDITRQPARPPAPRSAALAAMARAETGALVALWYRSILGPDGDVHEVTLGEVRHGRLPLRVRHPHTGNPVVIGEFRATEAEAIEDLDGADDDRRRFDVGYGLCFGHNERKAIAMANLDIANRRFGRRGPLEQLLLLTTDGLDSGGFLEHLKLPHYVTFRSMVESKQALQAAAAAGAGPVHRPAEPAGKEC